MQNTIQNDEFTKAREAIDAWEENGVLEGTKPEDPKLKEYYEWGFQNGAQWAYEWMCKADHQFALYRNVQDRLDKAVAALEMILASYEYGDSDFMREPGDPDFIQNMEIIARETLKELGELDG